MAIQTRIKQRFDPLSSWIQNDIVLLRGELAVVDCGNQIRFKIGDGAKHFTQLSFVDQTQLCTHWIAAEAISQGLHAASVPYGFAAGAYLCANANFSQALGFDAQIISSDTYSFVWNGDDTRAIGDYYTSHGKGTFSINALSGLSGIFVGEQSLAELLDSKGGNKITIDDRISGICQQSDLSVVKLCADEYYQLVSSGNALSNCLYVVQNQFSNMYGQQIKNVAIPTDLSDATNKEYVDSAISSNLNNFYRKSETSSSIEISTAFESIDTGNKIFIDNKISSISGYSDLNIVKLDASEYSALLTSNSLLSNALYIVEDDHIDAYGEQIKNVALPIDLSDAANKEYVDLAISSKVELSDLDAAIDEGVVPAVFRNVQLVKPQQPEGYRLHFRGDIARDDQFEDIVAANFDSASQERWQFFKHFVVDGLSGTWETMLSNGFYTDADDVPASFYFADALSSIGEEPKISSQYFLRYFWYYELSGVEHRSDQFSIAIPSNTAVGANPGDIVHKGEFYDLKQTVQPLKQIIGIETDYNQYYVCRPSIVTEISGALSGEFDILLDDYEASNIYRFQFLVGEAAAYPKFYIDYGNGPELAPDLSINQDSYIFEAGTRYYTEVQNDILKVDMFGYGAVSSLPSRYKLITAELSSLSGSLYCMIEDHSITTIEISSSSIPVVVYLPEKADDGARDFIIRVEISSQTAPGFTFAGLDESMIFDSEDDDWAVLEPGLNLISFTETR